MRISDCGMIVVYFYYIYSWADTNGVKVDTLLWNGLLL